MVELQQVVYDWLTEASTLQTEIAGRAWTPVPPKDFKNDAGGSIVFFRQGWNVHPTGAIHTPVYVFRCYGGNALAKSAGDVGRLLFDRLHHADGAVASGRIVTAEVAGGGGLVKEPDTKFWADISSYAILIEG